MKKQAHERNLSRYNQVLVIPRRLLRRWINYLVTLPLVRITKFNYIKKPSVESSEDPSSNYIYNNSKKGCRMQALGTCEKGLVTGHSLHCEWIQVLEALESFRNIIFEFAMEVALEGMTQFAMSMWRPEGRADAIWHEASPGRCKQGPAVPCHSGVCHDMQLCWHFRTCCRSISFS